MVAPKARSRSAEAEEGEVVSVETSTSSASEAKDDGERTRSEETTPEDELLRRIEARREAMFRRRGGLRTRERMNDIVSDDFDDSAARSGGKGEREGSETPTTSGQPDESAVETEREDEPTIELDAWKKKREETGVGRPPKLRKQATELVFVFERPGEGWGEQILPNISAKRRVVDTRAPQKALTVGEEYLIEEIGLTQDDVVSATSAAAAWRTTKKGRALVDKRRLRFAQKNILPFVQVLFDLGAGKEDVALILRQFPILLSLECDIRWNLSVFEYAVRQKTETGGRKGPIRAKDWPGRSPKSLKEKDQYIRAWITEQRDLRKQGQLTPEQMYLLDYIGFDAEKYKTKYETSRAKRWDTSFEELISFQMASGETNPPYEPGMTGLGAWLEEQRELYRRGELDETKAKRLRAQGVALDSNEALEAAKRLANTGIRDVTVEPIETTLMNTEFTQSAIELRSFLDENGPFAEPQIGSPLGVWLMKTRVRIRDGNLSEEDMKVLDELDINITYIPESWISMLNTYADLKARRSNFLGVDISRVQAWQVEQAELMKRNDGSLSQAQMDRFRAVSRSAGISGFASNAARAVREERAKEFAEFEARVAARKARLEKLQQLKLNSIDEDEE